MWIDSGSCADPLFLHFCQNRGAEDSHLKNKGSLFMRQMLAVLVAIGTLSVFSTIAGAAPMGPASMNAATSAVNSDLLLVRDGCGRGYHLTRWGVCRRNLGPHHGGCWWVRGRYGHWRLICR